MIVVLPEMEGVTVTCVDTGREELSILSNVKLAQRVDHFIDHQI